MGSREPAASLPRPSDGEPVRPLFTSPPEWDPAISAASPAVSLDGSGPDIQLADDFRLAEGLAHTFVPMDDDPEGQSALETAGEAVFSIESDEQDVALEVSHESPAEAAAAMVSSWTESGESIPDLSSTVGPSAKLPAAPMDLPPTPLLLTDLRPGENAPVPPAVAPGLALVEDLLERAGDRERVAEALLWFSQVRFVGAALFVVRGGQAAAWLGTGALSDPALLRTLLVPLDHPSIFKSAAAGRSTEFVPSSETPLDTRFLAFCRLPPRSALVAAPIVAGDCVVELLFGVCAEGTEGVAVRGDVERAVEAASRAYERIRDPGRRGDG